MKVDVIQASDITFKKWRYWSSWFDVSVVSLGGSVYLIQMKVSRMNGKSFKSVRIDSRFNIYDLSPVCVGDLTQMKGGR